MKTKVENSQVDESKYSLRQFVNQLVKIYQPVAVKQNSFLLNDIPAHHQVLADKQVLANILNAILYIAARCASGSCIRIGSETYSESILLTIADNNSANKYSVLSGSSGLQILAEKIGGVLDITSNVYKGTKISFSFVNRKSSITSQRNINKEDANYVRFLKAS